MSRLKMRLIQRQKPLVLACYVGSETDSNLLRPIVAGVNYVRATFGLHAQILVSSEATLNKDTLMKHVQNILDALSGFATLRADMAEVHKVPGEVVFLITISCS